MNQFEQKPAMAEFDIEELIASTSEYVAPPQDDLLPRYGISMLINLPLYNHGGNSAMINAYRRDAGGVVIGNTPYFPRLVLMPFRNITAAIPAETRASSTASRDSEAHARQFNPALAESQDGMIKFIKKSARVCAEFCENNYKSSGFALLHSLTGIENYAQAKEYFYMILPLKDKKLFPESSRAPMGEEFTSPFLDEILEYLRSPGARQKLNELRVAPEERERLAKLYSELLAAANIANTIAKGQIADTEQQISANPQQKNGYDIRDPQYAHSPEPFDLVCLAHRKEKPKDERALEQARVLQESGNQPMAQVAESMNALAQMMLEQNRSASSNPAVGMTAEQIQQMVDDGIKAALAEKTAQPAEIVPEETSAKTAKK